MLIAADVANGSKHLGLTNERADGAHQTRNDWTVYVGTGVGGTFFIEDGHGNEYEAVTLADRCLAEWRTLLAARRLPEPSF